MFLYLLRATFLRILRTPLFYILKINNIFEVILRAKFFQLLRATFNRTRMVFSFLVKCCLYFTFYFFVFFSAKKKNTTSIEPSERKIFVLNEGNIYVENIGTTFICVYIFAINFSEGMVVDYYGKIFKEYQM